ncbi:MAG: NAD+ synthase (glutamine-hydrolyzing) [Verrucomicrobiales bacterium]
MSAKSGCSAPDPIDLSQHTSQPERFKYRTGEERHEPFIRPWRSAFWISRKTNRSISYLKDAQSRSPTNIPHAAYRTSTMKIGFAQINTTIGDFAGNAERISQAYKKCVREGAEVVLTPEMSIVGYPPRDLVFRSNFIPESLQVRDQLAKIADEVPLFVGYIDYNGAGSGPKFTNSAAMLHKGRVLGRADKSLLPTYDVFDEARYFQPGSRPQIWQAGPRRFGITICEDIWTEENLPNKLYVDNPPNFVAQRGADLIVNLSASPFSAGKPKRRAEMLKKVSSQLHRPIAYCNAVGGNDHLVFDGYSMAVNTEGKLAHVLPGFEECVEVRDLTKPGQQLLEEEIRDIRKALVLGVRDYVGKCGFKQVVLGLSGGIDSALTAAIAAEAIGPENVLGVMMPSQISSKGSVDDSVKLAKNLGIEIEKVPIGRSLNAMKASLKGAFGDREEDVTEENLQARMRGMILMSISNKFGRLLLTTGNKSELAVGYCTIYGDMCGGLAVISDLPKGQVYALARWINRENEIIPWETIDKAPSAELRPDQKDQDTLPPYDVLDQILELLVEQARSVKEVVNKGFDEETVRWIARRVDLNEWKRQQAAPGIRVTTKAFGVGRRIPIAQRFWETG